MDNPTKKFSIKPGEKYVIKQSDIGPKTINPESYNRSLALYLTGLNTEEIFIKIAEKCLVATKDSEHSLINLNNYFIEKINDEYYKFTYTFTQEDYNRAVDCQ